MRWLVIVCVTLNVLAHAEESQFWVSVGSFSVEANARERLEHATEVTGGYFELRSGDTGVLRVVSGPYLSREEAASVRDRYRDRGFEDSWIISGNVGADCRSGFSRDCIETEQPPIAEDSVPELVEEAPPGYQLNRIRTPNAGQEERSTSWDWLEGTDFDVRIKGFATVSMLPDHDLQRSLQGTPVTDSSVDVRMMLMQPIGPVQLIAHHSTVLVNGDRLELNLGPDAALDQTVSDDTFRRWRWTWDIEDGSRHASFHRLDRLALEWQVGSWGFTVGRQAVSWGGGIVFQPMDLFSPFSPTVVDRDYKAGDDLILIDRLLGNGHDLQLLHVARRDEFSDVDQDVASSALKWHGYLGPVEFEVLAGEHYGSNVFGGAVRFPVGQALVRADVIASETEQGGYVYSGVLNADISFMLWDRNAYTFVEYFHNGWGVTDLPDNPLFLPTELTDRLSRGEVFNLMKNYVALGFTYEWHPLINQSTTVISNLHDQSNLLQIGLSYTPSDNQSVQVGWLEPLGSAGDEYGGVPLLGKAVTTGGASRAYFRWVYYL